MLERWKNGGMAMVKKHCRVCSKVSYSLSEKGMWICPHCAADITDQPTMRLAPCVAGVLPIVPPKDIEECCLN